MMKIAAGDRAALVVRAAALAQATPVGLWKTIDDETKKEKSLVRISESGGVLSGRIEKLLDPTPSRTTCATSAATSARTSRSLGMTIIRNAKPDARRQDVWTGGEILDPNNGKIYKLRLKPVDGGKTLEVRGYIGPFFRNQTWIRVE